MARRAAVLTVWVLVSAVTGPGLAVGQQVDRVFDSFTDQQDPRYLQRHVPEVRPSGTGWRWLNGGGRTLVTGGVVTNVEGTTREAWTYESGLPDAVVAIDVTTGSADPHGGVIFRNVSPNEYFLLDVAGPTLLRDDNGYLQYLGSGRHQVHGGETHRLEVRFSGADIQVFFDHAFEFGVSDWTYADGVQHGFFADATTDPRASFDNFEIAYVAGGPLPCEYAVSPLGQHIDAAPYSGSVTVSAPPGCVWSAWSEADFIHVVETGGNGPGVVTYGVENSTRVEGRTGTFSVADSTVTITQSGVAAPPAATAGAPAAPLRLAPQLSGDGHVIVWSADRPDEDRVNLCLGNCGAGCSSAPNPCGGRGYWSNEWLGPPVYLDNDFPVSTCAASTIETDIYRRYVVTGRWTYHGRSSDGCRLHDQLCRAMGGGVAAFLGCVLAAVVPGSAYCLGVRDETWSYVYTLEGHSADPVATFISVEPCGTGL